MTKEEEDLYAKDVIISFLPKGVKLEDCEHLVVEWWQSTPRTQLEARG